MPHPKEILAPNRAALAILWDDGHESFFPAPLLRRICPCAECRQEQMENKAVLQLVQGGPRLEISDFHPVGKYALGITWGDGHQNGIYSFEFLRGLCPCEECAGEEE